MSDKKIFSDIGMKEKQGEASTQTSLENYQLPVMPSVQEKTFKLKITT